MEGEKNKVNTDFVEIPDSKMGSEKVASTVATFLNKDGIERLFRRVISYDYQEVDFEYMKVLTIKRHQKR